jgi:hypothetical protein
MKLPRVRFTVRGLMVAVTVVGILMASARTGWRCWYCWEMAQCHAGLKSRGLILCGVVEWTPEQKLALSKERQKLTEYHAKLGKGVTVEVRVSGASSVIVHRVPPDGAGPFQE